MDECVFSLCEVGLTRGDVNFEVPRKCYILRLFPTPITSFNVLLEESKMLR